MQIQSCNIAMNFLFRLGPWKFSRPSNFFKFDSKVVEVTPLPSTIPSAHSLCAQVDQPLPIRLHRQVIQSTLLNHRHGFDGQWSNWIPGLLQNNFAGNAFDSGSAITFWTREGIKKINNMWRSWIRLNGIWGDQKMRRTGWIHGSHWCKTVRKILWRTEEIVRV